MHRIFTLYPLLSPSWLAIVWLIFSAYVVQAAPLEQSPTLRRIAEAGEITIGFNETAVPFVYNAGEGKIVGYSYEIALKVAEFIKRELNLPQLAVRPISITTQNRFAMVQNGSVSLLCGATTHTKEREKQAAFSSTIFISGTQLLTRKDSGIREFTDLAGKTVVTFADSTSEKILRKLNREQNLRINIVSSFDRGTTPLSILQVGQADAYMMDDVFLHAALHEAWRPGDWLVTGKPQSFEAYGCILPKDDPVFKNLVDREIARIMISGEAATLYRKWLMSPIPPKGTNLNFPPSAAMLDLFKNPNDRPFE